GLAVVGQQLPRADPGQAGQRPHPHEWLVGLRRLADADGRVRRRQPTRELVELEVAGCLRRLLTLDRDLDLDLACHRGPHVVGAAGACPVPGAGTPNGVRTRVATLKGWNPGPLDDGVVMVGQGIPGPW